MFGDEKTAFARRSTLVTAVAGISVIGLSASGSHAAVRTWSGTAASNTLSTTGNWDTLPTSGDAWTFPAGATYSSNNLNNDLTTGATTWNVAGITFSASAPALVIGDGTTTANTGNAFTLTGTITNSGTAIETINTPFALQAAGNTVGSNASGTFGAIVLGGNLSGTGGLTLFDTVTLSGTNTFSGNITLPGGTASSSATLIFSSASNLGSGTTISLGSNARAGTLKYTGLGETISRNIIFNSGNAGSTAVLDSSGTGTFNYGGTLTNSGKSKSMTLQGSTSGIVSGGLVDDSTNILSLTAATGSSWTLSGTTSTYLGTTTVNGTLAGIGANAFGNTSGISVGAAGVLSLRGDTSTSFVKASNNSTLYSVASSANGATINVDQATPSGTAPKTMTIGTLGTTSTATNVTINLTGADNTSLTTGAVTGQAISAASTLTLNNTNVSGTTTIAGYTGANTSVGETLIIGGTGNTTVSGAITPSASAGLKMTKNGTGALTLAGVGSIYAGITTLNGGKLVLTNTAGSATGTGAVTANSSTSAATVTGTGSSAGLLTVSGASHVAPGINTLTPAGDVSNLNNFGAAGTIAMGSTGGITLTNANLDFDLGATSDLGTSDLIDTGGTLTLTSVVVNFNGLSGSGVLQTGTPYVLIAGLSNSPTTAALANIGTTNFFGTLAGNYTASYSSITDITGIGGNDLAVTFSATAAPEPSLLTIAGIAAFGLLGRRRGRLPNQLGGLGHTARERA